MNNYLTDCKDTDHNLLLFVSIECLLTLTQLNKKIYRLIQNINVYKQYMLFIKNDSIKNIIKYSFSAGHLDLIINLHNNSYKFISRHSYIKYAFRNQQIKILDYVDNHICKLYYTMSDYSYAQDNNHLNILEWFGKNHKTKLRLEFKSEHNEWSRWSQNNDIPKRYCQPTSS